jgi:GNAT superfamily N-acetyltransferase
MNVKSARTVADSSLGDVSTIRVHRVTPKRWPHVVDLFERPGTRGGQPVSSGCWCQYWHLRGKAYHEGFAGANRARLEREIASRRLHALLAYDDGVPVGWCRLGPRKSFERLAHTPTAPRIDDEEVWSVVCFYVHSAAKRKGVATALLEHAIEHAAAKGARILEGYAVPSGHMNVDAYTGYLPMYLAAGFEPKREGSRRTVVRRTLS